MLTYTEARHAVIAQIRAAGVQPPVESTELSTAAGRVLAEDVRADRDYPPFDRAARDGYAVRAGDTAPGIELKLIGEVRAGSEFTREVPTGCCVSIMTGAPQPRGTDAVVMIEHTQSAGTRVRLERSVERGENFVPRGSEVPAGAVVVPAGKRIGAGEVAMLASVGCAQVRVFRQPRVGILPTGDEVVDVGLDPLAFQIRNSNSYSLQCQVAAAGGFAMPLGIAPDEYAPLRDLIERGLTHDLLVLSGGVSVGKYDLVEQVLRDLGAEFYFDAVAIQPGKPLVFGRARDTFFFGLPGNPLSTVVTFELFARAALELLSGAEPTPLVFPRARLAEAVRHKPGLTRFWPAVMTDCGGEPAVRPAGWKGSGDVVTLVRANCWMVVPADRAEIPAGEWIAVMPRV